MPRAFTAIDIPREIAEKLSNAQEEIDVGRPVKPSKMHITFEFFRELSEEELQTLENHLQGLEFEDFEIEIKDLGVFPSESYIRVIWAGAESDKIRELYQQASNHPVSSDNDHDFRPHVTIGRVDDVRRGDKKKIHDTLEKYSGTSFGTFTAEKVKLYRSELRPEGSEYTEIYVKDL